MAGALGAFLLTLGGHAGRIGVEIRSGSAGRLYRGRHRNCGRDGDRNTGAVIGPRRCSPAPFAKLGVLTIERP